MFNCGWHSRSLFLLFSHPGLVDEAEIPRSGATSPRDAKANPLPSLLLPALTLGHLPTLTSLTNHLKRIQRRALFSLDEKPEGQE